MKFKIGDLVTNVKWTQIMNIDNPYSYGIILDIVYDGECYKDYVYVIKWIWPKIWGIRETPEDVIEKIS